MNKDQLTNDAIQLLCRLVATPSVSRDEAAAADIMEEAMAQYGLHYKREGNNLWTIAPNYDPHKPTILLNAHIDTVKPVSSWKRNPYEPTIENDVLYGLGSNDCGGGLVSLLQVFRYLSGSPRTYNLLYLASAEEEVSGINGIRRVLPLLPKIDVAVVGEPTGMQPAVAEKGLMVVDAEAKGVSGHAARGEGVNAIYEALDDLLWLRGYRFGRVSELLGPTVMNVTIVNSGTQHNVIPDKCTFTIDVRTNEHYRNEDVFNFLQQHLKSKLKARSFHLSSSGISLDHPLVRRCMAMGKRPFGSPTLSDQALMRFPSFKLGPGQSARSHSADEYICISEISDAISTYIQLLEGAEL